MRYLHTRAAVSDSGDGFPLAELERLLGEVIEEARRVQQSYAPEWSPGRQRTLKDALMLLERVVMKVERLPGDGP
jgi:hypothetical protein